MKRAFWMKLIIGITVFITIINGILPTNVTFADEEAEYDDEVYDKFECKEDGTYVLELEGTTQDGMLVEWPLQNFGERGIEDIYYIENGKQVTPQSDGNGRVELEAGKEYYYIKNIAGFNDVNLVKTNYWHEDILNNNNGYLLNNGGEYIEGRTVFEKKDSASLLEELVTKILMLLGTGLYTVVCLIIGEVFSVEKVIFNEYSNTRLSFFNNDKSTIGDNAFLNSANIEGILEEFFNFFTGVAVTVYLIILLYMAIKIMLGSTAEKGAKYKELIVYWLEGVVILFLFPYVMRFAILINHSFVAYVYEAKDTYIDMEMPETPVISGKLEDVKTLINQITLELQAGKDFMSIMYQKAMRQGWLVYAVCWYVMFFQMIGFLIAYFRRVLITIFLIAIFPLVMISYAIDKIGDAKSQAFDNWVKEFMVNVFVQSFHAISYVLIMSLICQLMDNPEENWLLILVSISFVSKGDDILRAIFSLSSGANTVKSVGSAVMEAAAISKLSNKVRGVGKRLVGPNSAGRAVTNKIGDYWQKYHWDRKENRVERTAAQIELKKNKETDIDVLNGNPMKDKTPKEIEEDIRKSIDILLGNKKNATADEIRNAADKLTGYMNQNKNEAIQNIIDKIAKDLTPEQRKALDKILRQNSAANALMVGGKQIDLKQKIDIVLSCLTKDANGNLTKESQAILNKIAESESELQSVKMFSNIKFNKKNVHRVSNVSERVSQKGYKAKRNGSGAVKGRGAAKKAKEGSDAKNSLELIRNKSKNSVPPTRKKGKRIAGRARNPGQERASDKINQQTQVNTAAAQSKVNNKKSVFKVVKKPKNSWDNIKGIDRDNPIIQGSKASGISSLERTAMVYAAQNAPKTPNTSSTTTSYANKVPERRNILVTPNAGIQGRRERTENLKAVRSVGVLKNNSNKAGAFNGGSQGTKFKISRGSKKPIKSGSQNVSGTTSTINNNQANTRNAMGGGTMYNAGAELANKQGSAENLQGILNDAYVASVAQSTLDSMLSGKKSEFGSSAEVTYNSNASEVSMPSELDKYINEKFNGKSYSQETKADFTAAIKGIKALTLVNEGDFTAKQVLGIIDDLKQIKSKYEFAGVDERTGLEDIMKDLGGNLEDFESCVRIRILNDPDSVGNDRKIIDESKEYVKNSNIPNALKNKLGYNIEDLTPGRNLKYVQSSDTEHAGMISDTQKARASEEYEARLKNYNLNKKIEALDREYKEKYSLKSKAKDIGSIAGSAALFVGDTMISTVGAAGVGFVAAGMATDGSKDSLGQSAANFFTGYSASNEIYDNLRDDVGIAADFVRKNSSFGGTSSSNKNRSSSNLGAPPKNLDTKMDELKDKTDIYSSSFEKRGKK